MADIADLMGFNFEDKRAASQWELVHFSSHQAIRDAIQAAGLGNLAVWPLYPVNWSDWNTYSLWHQSAHNEMSDALGLSTTDLTDVDLKDPQASAQWHLDHYSEHFAASAALGI